ncbi:hypothetical protein ASPZODRAFT_1758881 [Penicilliopsis zonata CBS 506.65]|uniref:Pentacotripeptide-repeat region of PRORP domain-containing protein n=1 Tax=Penicilliopsis zonata CBS 506.65 TaxID=1073090 RepID=A0A1L9SKM2_9EURO|nr:hypothetical protein ASPZODRAFT_1758881 [Penicilliopsis zonata CBS 506.65]OJJ47715.1 hypothetical protein ASPZODRAFT_1758881 [Penicilliopsis zonata CBS 506.65]
MLERAAGCLESAGRRFFQDSNGAIRSRRLLPSQFWQYTLAGSDASQWAGLLLQASNSRTHSALGVPSAAIEASNETRVPVLDFLYPPQTQEYAARCLLRSPKRLMPRRGKRLLGNVARTYTSETLVVSEDNTRNQIGSPGVETSGRDHVRGIAKQELIALLNAPRQTEYTRAYDCYVRAGNPADCTSAMLAYVSASEWPIDRLRVRRLFDEIPVEHRSAEDYSHAVMSELLVDNASKSKRIYQEAIAKGLAHKCSDHILSYFFKKMDWHNLEDLWATRPSDTDIASLNSAMLHIDTPPILKRVSSLAAYLENRGGDSLLGQLASLSLSDLFQSLQAMESISTYTTLQILRRYNKIGILTPDHYFDLIKTLGSSRARPTFVRALVVYRNFRWLMKNQPPPESLLNLLLQSFAFFRISTGVEYIIYEYAHFYAKPSLEVYKNALIALSRSGEVDNVQTIFDKFLKDHGKPLSQRLITPLLYVHAKSGNVPETTRQFERVSTEFGLEQNTICWNILLAAYANADDPRGALETFERMMSTDVELDSHTFGTMMGIFAHKGDLNTIRHLLLIAKQRQVHITAPIIDTIVETYCNDRRLDLAEGLAETCLPLDIKGSKLRMWNVLLWNHAFRMDLESVSRIRQRMEEVGLQFDEMTYGALMLCLVLSGQPDSARRILRTLHRSRRVWASEFLYAIVIFGYVRARNRDMVHIIFEEMRDRFQKLGLGSKLLYLKSQLQRDLQLVNAGAKTDSGVDLRLQNAEKFLMETITDFNPKSLVKKQPSPGTARQSLREAFPAMYYEYMITAYGSRGALWRAQELFDQFIERQKIDVSPDYTEDSAPLRLLSALMLSYLKAEKYKEVEECWKMGFPRAIKMSTSPGIEQWLSPNPVDPRTDAEPPRPVLPKHSGKETDPLVVRSPAPASSTEFATILPSCRFILSRCLSLYMRSLGYRNKQQKIPSVIADVQKAGFAISTFNWSTYVQMLASSDRYSDQIEAFKVFEEKFMPNFPGWKYLRRGYGLRPDNAPSTLHALEQPKRGIKPGLLGKAGRRYWSKIQPDYMQPTYVSMVYLASALLHVREKSIQDGATALTMLYNVAPQTIEAIGEMPYLREKFQGVLLRSRQEQVDKKKDVDRNEPLVWTGGILGVNGRIRAPFQPKEEEREEDEIEKGQEILAEEHTFNTFSVSESTLSESEQTIVHDSPSLPDQIIDYPDEFDLEAETTLQLTRGSSTKHDEPHDLDQRPDDKNECTTESSPMEDSSPATEPDTEVESPSDGTAKDQETD